ncbi:MAG: hypothetical protein MSH60_01540 [Ruminococcus sp.]|nr:hypothetical protein [Ruminococcus sp.]
MKSIRTLSHNRYDLAGKYIDTQQDILDYDLMNVIMVCLGDSDTKECRGIIRMLHSLLVARIPAAEKKRIVHEEYGIPMNKEIDKEVDDMCNISSLYINRSSAEGIEIGEFREKVKMIAEMFRNSIPVPTIANIAHLSVEETEKIIRENT